MAFHDVTRALSQLHVHYHYTCLIIARALSLHVPYYYKCLIITSVLSLLVPYHYTYLSLLVCNLLIALVGLTVYSVSRDERRTQTGISYLLIFQVGLILR